MSEHWVVDIETTRRDTAPELDAMLEALASWHGAVGQTPAGCTSATITLPADSIAQATVTALHILHGAGLDGVVSMTVVLESVRDAREGWCPMPDLVSVTEAAGMLEVSRQRVLQMIGEGKVSATRVGRDWVIDAASVHRQ